MRQTLRALALLAVAAAILVGCASAPRPAPRLLTDEEIQQLPQDYWPIFDKFTTEGENNAVLNYDTLAVKALFDPRPLPPELRTRVVKSALDESILRVDTIIADTPEARRARSLWFSEKMKDFRGEPYERAMVYFIRGCVYFADGDLQNARACFLSGALQDAVAEEDQFRSDFASMDLMAGACDQLLGDTAQAGVRFAAARSVIPSMPVPSPQDNAFIVVFLGAGPRKESTGTYGESLRILPGGTAVTAVTVGPAGAQPQIASLIENVSWQATTRGGREVDVINGHKAIFKGVTQAVAVGAMATGLAIASSGDRNDVTAGAIVAGAGLLALGASAMMHPQADTRTWANLPHEMHLWSGALSPGRYELQVQFWNAGRQCVGTIPVTLDVGTDPRHPALACVQFQG